MARCCTCAPIPVLAVMVGLILAAGGSCGEPKAATELKRLAERAAKATGDVNGLLQDIQDIRRAYPGTPQAVAAAKLLRDLPSPLDKYEAKSIPPLEKFAWQPPELVAVLGEHRGRQGGAVTSVVYSRDGKMLVSGSTNGYVRLWDPATMRLQHVLLQGGGTFALAISKDNTFLAGGSGDGSVQLWDVTGVPLTGKPPKNKETFKIASSKIFGVAIAPTGKVLAVASGDNRLSLWDLADNPPRETASGDTHTGAVHTVAFSLDGKTLATGSADKTLRLWSVSKDNKLKEKALVAHPGGVLAVAYHPMDEKTLLTGCADGMIRIWNVVGGKLSLRSAFKGDSGAVHAVAFSPSGKTLASAHGNGTCRTWTIGELSKEKAFLEGHTAPATAVAFSPDGSTITTGSHDWTVRQWPAVSGLKPRDKTALKGHLSHVYAMRFAEGGKSLASGSFDRTIRIWDMVAPEAEHLPHVKADVPIYNLAYAPDGKSMAGSGTGTTFRTYDAGTRRFLYTFQGHTAQISGLAYSPDGSLIATSAGDKSVRLWNPKTGKAVYTFTAFEAPAQSVAFSPDGKYILATAGTQLLGKNGRPVVKEGANIYVGSTVRVYDVSSKEEVFRWKDDKVLPQRAAFLPGGQRFVVGASDFWLRAWSWPEPQPTDPAILSKGVNAAIPFASSSDGRYLAALSGGVAVLDAATGKRLRHWVFQEHYGAIAFAPDSRHVAVALGTGVIYLLRVDEVGKK